MIFFLFKLKSVRDLWVPLPLLKDVDQTDRLRGNHGIVPCFSHIEKENMKSLDESQS